MNEVKNFLSNYSNYNTKRNLRIAITDFFKAIYGEATSENLDEMAKKYFSEKQQINDEDKNKEEEQRRKAYEEDIRNFLSSLNGSAPLTIRLKISNIKTFLLEHDIELPQKFWKKIRRRIKGSRALTLDRIPQNTELRQLITHMSVHGKALYLTLESSGMRIGEGLKSNIDDLYLNEEPARIQIRGEVTKSGNSRHAFISREANEALTEWLKVRDEYLKAAVAKSHLYKKSLEDSRIFPFESKTAYLIWRKALHKSGLNGRDKSTNREMIHPHTLRKLFRTRLGAAGIPIDIVEALMGHEGYLTEVYRKYTLEDLRKFYLKGEAALLVFTETQEVTKLLKQVEITKKEVDETNKSLQTLVTELTTKNLSLENKLTNISSENQGMNNRLEELEKKDKETKEKMKDLEKALLEMHKIVTEMSKSG